LLGTCCYLDGKGRSWAGPGQALLARGRDASDHIPARIVKAETDSWREKKEKKSQEVALVGDGYNEGRNHHWATKAPHGHQQSITMMKVSI
jgi:hypothetical protein